MNDKPDNKFSERISSIHLIDTTLDTVEVIFILIY